MDSSEQFQTMLTKATESERQAFAGFDWSKNVQDQLQAMVSRGLWRKIGDFMEFVFDSFYDGWHVDERNDWFTSMEQIWLAFVMKQNHNKTWDGWKSEDWV